MLDFLFNNSNPKEETKVIVSKEDALARLALKESDLIDFKNYIAATPMQRIMMDLNFKDDLLSLLLMSNGYYQNNQAELKFSFTTADVFKEQALELINKIDIFPNKLLFIKLVYNIYGLYYTRLYGNKEEQLKELSMTSIPIGNIGVFDEAAEETLVSKAIKYSLSKINTPAQERKRNKRNRQRQRRRERKQKLLIDQIE